MIPEVMAGLQSLRGRPRRRVERELDLSPRRPARREVEPDAIGLFRADDL